MVKSFVFPGDIIGSLSSAHAKEACTFNFVALESGVVVEIDFDRLYNTSQDDVQLAMAVVHHLLIYGIEKERRERTSGLANNQSASLSTAGTNRTKRGKISAR